MLFTWRSADSSIVRQVLGGDREAFGQLVNRYFRTAYAMSWGYVGNHADTDDAVQESFLTAFQKLDWPA